MPSNRNSNQQITTTASSSSNAASPRSMSAEAKQEASSEFYLWSCAKKSVAGRLYGVTLKCMISVARGSRHRSSTDGCSRNCSREKLSRCTTSKTRFISLLCTLYTFQSWVFLKTTVKYVVTGSVYVEYCCSSWTFLSIYVPIFGPKCVFLRMKTHQINPVSLRFVDAKLEGHYSSEKEKRSGAAFCCCMMVLFFITAMEVFVDPT